MAKRLTETQSMILAAAAGRDDGALLPLPDGIVLSGGACHAVLKSLIDRGLAEEVDGYPAWKRQGDDDAPKTLRITAAGLDAIGVTDAATADGDRSSKFAYRDGEVEVTNTAEAVGQSDPEPDRGPALPPTKLDTILGLLRRPEGATIAAMQEATGWQPHSVRAYLTGFRKRGFNVVREKGESGSVYRILEG